MVGARQRTHAIRGRTVGFVEDEGVWSITLDGRPVATTIVHGEVVRNDDGTTRQRVLGGSEVGLELYLRSDGTLLDFGAPAGPVKLQTGFFHPDKPGTSVFVTITFGPGGGRASVSLLEDAVSGRATYLRLDWILRRVRQIRAAQRNGEVEPRLTEELAANWKLYCEAPRITYPWPFPWPTDIAALGRKLTAGMGEPAIKSVGERLSWGEAPTGPTRTPSGVLRDIFKRDVPPRTVKTRGHAVTVSAPDNVAAIHVDDRPLTVTVVNRRVVIGVDGKPVEMTVTEGTRTGLDSYLLSTATLLDFGDEVGPPVLRCGYALDHDEIPVTVTIRFPRRGEAEVTIVEDLVSGQPSLHAFDAILASARALQKLDRDPHDADAWLRKIQRDTLVPAWAKYCAGPRWTYPWPFPWPKDLAAYGRELTRDLGSPALDAPAPRPTWDPDA